MVKVSRVNVNANKHNVKVAKWAKYIKNVKMEKEKKEEDEKTRKEEERVRAWKRRASLMFMEQVKSNHKNEEAIPRIDVKAVLEDTKKRNQTSERSDLGGDCMCCYENFTNTTHKPIAFQCGHVVCVSCAPMLKKCPTCSKVVTGMIVLHI